MSGPARVCGVQMLFSRLAPRPTPICGRKLFGTTDYCYWHFESIEKYSAEAIELYFGPEATLKSAIETEVKTKASLEMAYLVNAQLGGTFLESGCSLRGGIFIRANLSQAKLSYCDLREANLRFANLENAYLSSCNLANSWFVGSQLFNAKFRDNNFNGIVGLTKENFKGLRWGWLPIFQMLEDYPDQCEGVYRSLAIYFSSQGLFDDASWAAYRSRLMRHRVLTKRLSSATLLAEETVPAIMANNSEQIQELLKTMLGFSPRQQSWRFAARRISAFLEWGRSFLLRFIMGYGEKPLRVMGNALLLIFIYAVIYQFGAINDKSFISCLYFSAITFTTVGYGDLAPHGAFRLVAASEALWGILLCGLFLFCLSRRSVGRS
jgi:hypothetical protein